ncbi:NAD(P)/FAD-dependent oxidoreductase [Marinococcus luteus]|uniref:NAD(P)/FAD-dependent oxidoreductase n=1 Tax=Marinococcus luteus TaxID=1122204 RepID=UPI002ACC8776|nr:NAD(P)/FAD-dependent oxidoreductase [Marinococcus luteus]MDZ5783432.1 NAD(P)/FAD-dependent oxidoreductase [Marinococcus luteus]
MTNVIVIGGGPAGLMASVAAAKHGADVTLIDKGSKLGRKLAISGGGRCNVTNRMERKELIEHIPGNGKFMHSPFSIFDNENIIRFFENLGIDLKEEDMGRMFPINDKAITVVNTLLDEMERLGVQTRTNTKVASIDYGNTKVQGLYLEDGTYLQADRVIIASGGKSVPKTGSTGDGYPWAEAAGHTITELYPTEVPITSPAVYIQDRTLQGISLSGVALTVYRPGGKAIKTHTGDMIFTHFGVSGPIGLRCSQYVVKALKKYKADQIELGLSLYPEENHESMFQRLVSLKKTHEAKTVKNALKGLTTERLLLFFLQEAGISSTMTIGEAANKKLRALALLFTDFRFPADGTLSIEEAFVTGGGVSIKEVFPKRLESRLKSGLFFCGEILDIHGYTGGFNITCAFSTGYTAGKSASEQPTEQSEKHPSYSKS